MFCSQCGAAVASDASFCHACGKLVGREATDPTSRPAGAPANPVPGNTSPPVKAIMAAAFQPIKPLVPTRRQVVISFVLAVALAATYGNVLIDALDGDFHTTVKRENVSGLIGVGGFAFWYFWKALNRKRWIGALVGIAISLLVLFGGAGISGYVKGQRADILDQVPQFAALKRNFPEVAEQVRQELRAISKDKAQNRQELATKITQKRFFPAFNAALKTTSDAAIVELTKAKMRQIKEVANSNANDCVMLMSGRLAGAPPEEQARVAATSSKETRQALQDAMVKVLNDADAHRNDPVLPDDKRFKALFEQLDSKLASNHGTSVYYFSDESLNKPSDVRCRAGLLLFSEALTLPEKDRLFVLTTMFSAE